MKRAIVLSGGGARGAYQIGVWKALRKLNIKYDIVTGTSVGALNGALMTQNTYYRGLWFWYNIKVKNVFSTDSMGEINIKEKETALYKKCAKAISKDHGLDASNLSKTIDIALDEERFRKSKIDYGLITVNLTTKKPIKITKNEIPKGKLNDYLMASAACYPAFKTKTIDDEEYIDGAYYDNLPINLAASMGATEIIAVDLKSLGIRRRLKYDNVKVTYITPRNKLGFLLSFHKYYARRGMRLGYNDAMKTFKKLDGDKFTFKHGDLDSNYKKYKEEYQNNLNKLKTKKKDNILEKVFKITNKNEIDIRKFNKTIEFLGKTFDLDDSLIYNIRIFNKKISYRMMKMEHIDKKLIKQKIKDMDLKCLFNNKNIIKYIYDELNACNNSKYNKTLSNLSLLFPKEFLGALYLYIIQK